MTWIFHAPLKPNHNTDNKSSLFTRLLSSHFLTLSRAQAAKNWGSETREKMIVGSKNINVLLTLIKLEWYYDVTSQGTLLVTLTEPNVLNERGKVNWMWPFSVKWHGETAVRGRVDPLHFVSMLKTLEGFSVCCVWVCSWTFDFFFSHNGNICKTLTNVDIFVSTGSILKLSNSRLELKVKSSNLELDSKF